MPAFKRLLIAIFPVHTRRGLLIVTLTLQAFVLSVGLLVVFNDIRHRVAVRLQDRILEQNVRTVESLAKTMDDMGFGLAECGTVGRERAQKMIEEIRLPAGGFVCLLDDNDKIICHPGLRADPGLCGVEMRDMRITDPENNDLVLGTTDRSQTIAGRGEFMDKGNHFLAAKYVPSMKARLVVQQPESGLLAFGDAVASGSMLPSAFLGAITLVLTGTISFVLIRRHNRTLEEVNRGLEREVGRRVRESLTARHSIILGLAKLAESRDTDTGDHLERIATYSAMLAIQMRPAHPEFTEEWIENLKLAASLHDIGKVGIPDHVLGKPGRLTPEERLIIEKHPAIGADTLHTLSDRMTGDALLAMSVEIARSHHEKWDGSGYPDHLAGVVIPLPARIVALADVYDALTSPRVYKPAMGHDDAFAIITAGAGTHFDPDVVKAFIDVSAQFDQVRATLQTQLTSTREALKPLSESALVPLRRAA